MYKICMVVYVLYKTCMHVHVLMNFTEMTDSPKQIPKNRLYTWENNDYLIILYNLLELGVPQFYCR
jgi:hypothetical protein